MGLGIRRMGRRSILDMLCEGRELRNLRGVEVTGG
jgi:hypothetical protein